jgi:DUF1680 family protein
MSINPGPIDTSHSPYACWRTLPLSDVTLQDGFWTARKQVNHSASLKHGYAMLEQAGNFRNFQLAATQATGGHQGRNFADETVYKWLEAAAYDLSQTPDDVLQQMTDRVIEWVRAAQQPDGYLNTYYTIAQPENRWTDLSHGHELYCAGHLFQAAVAHHRALGDGRLLDVARRLADHIDSIFGPAKRHGTSGHPEIEMALVELFRVTGEQRYLELAKFFIDQRGQGQMRGLGWYGPEYHQDRVPLREATEIEGHAVRAMYLMAGAADLYLETGEQALLDALLRLWGDMSTGKMHITGGVGARYEGESFGDPYELPNDHCYCETCAAIGSMMWTWRMLLATGQAQFADVLEQTLYNGFLSGPALDGTHFFYINPLLSRGGYERAEWYGVPCCPPNIMRTIAAVEHYLATRDAQGLQLHLFHSASIHTSLESGNTIRLRIESSYPWEGNTSLAIDETDGSVWRLLLRIPAWASGATIRVNGAPVEAHVQPGQYAVVERGWQVGDGVELLLPMTPGLVEAHPWIDATRSSAAIRRGPTLYCVEQVDHDDPVLAIQIDDDIPLQAEWDAGLLGGVVVVKASGIRPDISGWAGQLYRPVDGTAAPANHPAPIKAIPYFAWGNRGANAMRVWIPRKGH